MDLTRNLSNDSSKAELLPLLVASADDEQVGSLVETATDRRYIGAPMLDEAAVQGLLAAIARGACADGLRSELPADGPGIDTASASSNANTHSVGLPMLPMTFVMAPPDALDEYF